MQTIKQLEYMALAFPNENAPLGYEPSNLQIADLLRYIRLYNTIPTIATLVEAHYSLVKVSNVGILTYITPFNKSLANCVGCGTNYDQAYLDYCELLAKHFALVEQLDVNTIITAINEQSTF